jgi:hypothetical protein
MNALSVSRAGRRRNEERRSETAKVLLTLANKFRVFPRARIAGFFNGENQTRRISLMRPLVLPSRRGLFALDSRVLIWDSSIQRRDNHM